MRRFAILLLALHACGQPIYGELGDMLASSASGVTAKHRVTLRPLGGRDLCLEARPDKSVVLADCNDEEAQLFARYGSEIHGLGDECLAIEGEERDGARAVMADCKAAASRATWAFGHETLQFGHDKGKCLDVIDARYAPGAGVQIWNCVANDEAQQWGWIWGMGKMAEAPDQPAAAHAPAAPKAPAKPAEQAKPADPAKKPAPQAQGAAKPAAQHPMQAPQAASGGPFGPSPAGTLVAPYFYAWDSPGCVKWLKDAKAKAGLKAATMAFGLSGGGCKVAGFDEYAADIKAFQAEGGTVVLSFGGQSGTYLQKSCQNVGQIAQALLAQSKQHGTKLLDFDVEGENLDDQGANQRLVAALAQVQKQQSDTYVSFTLPVDPQAGLPGNAINLLTSAAKAGIKVSRVNLMAMDYGRKPKAGQTVGDLAIGAAQATGRQMQKIWPHASQAEINHAIGITPMIGQNDGDEDGPFLVSDAQKVAAWATQNGIGHLAYWAFQRDVAKNGDYNDHSNQQSEDYAYYKALSGK